MAVHILRIQVIDDPSNFILLRSEEIGKDNKLDIKLLATDEVTAYSLLVKAKRTSSLRSKNAPCTQEEFDSALFSILQGKPATGIPALKDVEVVASVDEGKSITLIIRKSISGITQRLGTLTLPQDEGQEADISLFDWCGLAVKAEIASNDELSTLTSKFEDQQKTVDKLTKQLEELLVAKKEHEVLLLEKMALLLNEKKLKIRDQQRLLATAKVDEDKLARVQATRRPGGRRAPAKSSKNKRKGPTPVEDEESEDGFDKMDVDDDDEPVANDSEKEDAATTDADETEDDEEEAPPTPPPSKVKSRIGNVRGKASRSENDAGRGAPSATIADEANHTSAIPAPRKLPFSQAKKAVPLSEPKPQLDSADESTESDDEL